MRGLQSELLKYRRTFTKKLAILLPLFFVFQAMPSIWLMPKNVVRGWEHVNTMVFNIWTVVFLPLGIVLFAYLIDMQERKAGNYRSLRAHAYSPGQIWINKVNAMVIFTFIATLILFLATICSGLITITDGKWDIPWKTIFTADFLAWISCLTIIPIQLWAATWNGMFASMGVGFAGLTAGMFVVKKSWWFILPWSWGTRMMCPVLQLDPNGVMLKAGDPLLDASVLPAGIILSVVSFFVITGLTALWFQRRELK